MITGVVRSLGNGIVPGCIYNKTLYFNAKDSMYLLHIPIIFLLNRVLYFTIPMVIDTRFLSFSYEDDIEYFLGTNKETYN